MASLSSVRIPRDAISVLKRIADLDDDHTNALVEALSTRKVRDMPALKAAVRNAVGQMVDALVAESVARKRAAAAGTDPDDEDEDGQPEQVTAIADYLARRGNLSRRVGGSSTPFGPGYDPLAGLR